MNQRIRSRVVVLVCALLSGACGAGGHEQIDVSVPATRSKAVVTCPGPSDILSSNALSSNALSSNALSSNALSSNALSSNALSSNALSSNALVAAILDDPCDGEGAAMIIKYSARCMLRPDQSVTVTYRTREGALASATFPGNIGIQPNWTTQGLNDTDRRWWVACLGAHVNNVGPVAISARANHHPALIAKGEERQTFDMQEGAIWGTYDPAASPPMHFYSCRGWGYDPDLTSRRCMANPGCGGNFTYLGECSRAFDGPCEVGQPNTPTNLDRCHGSVMPWSDDPSGQVITVFLHYDPPGTPTY